MQTAKFFYRNPDAPKPNKPTGLGVLALIERDGALLMECRSDCARWGLIGGAVDRDESLEEALRREVREETGLTVKSFTLFGTFSDPSRIAQYPDGNVVRVIGLVYRVEVDQFDTLRRSEESTTLRFVPRDELQRLDIVETARPIVDAYLSHQPGQPVILA